LKSISIVFEIPKKKKKTIFTLNKYMLHILIQLICTMYEYIPSWAVKQIDILLLECNKQIGQLYTNVNVGVNIIMDCNGIWIIVQVSQL